MRSRGYAQVRGSILKRTRSRPRRALASRAGVTMLALVSLVLIFLGVAIDVWMLTLPAAITSCTYSGSDSICDDHPNPMVQPWVGLLLAAAGVGLLVIAWRFDRRPGERPRQGWDGLRTWSEPLLWLVIVPLIAGPATFLLAHFSVNGQTYETWSGIMSGGAECPAVVFAPSVVIPGLLNLIPLWWLRAKDARTRLAAIVGSFLGVAGLAASLDVLHSLGPTISWNFGFLLPTPTPPQQADLAVGTVIWLATLITLLVIPKLPVGARP